MKADLPTDKGAFPAPASTRGLTLSRLVRGKIPWRLVNALHELGAGATTVAIANRAGIGKSGDAATWMHDLMRRGIVEKIGYSRTSRNVPTARWKMIVER